MAAPTFFGVSTQPADTPGSLAEPQTALALTPPASMLAGDLVVVFMYNESGSAGDGMQINGTGGQTWTSDTTDGSYSYSGSAAGHRIYWCTFNGTWSADPTFDFPAKSGTRGCGMQMLVFRPDATTKEWALDTGPTWAGFSAPSTPFTVTITAGYTPANDDTVTIGRWLSDDDNTYGALTGGGSPNNWQKNGLGAQYRNQGGSDLSASYAYVLLGTKQPIENVSQQQLALGGDAGSTCIVTFRAAAATRTANLTATLGAATISAAAGVTVGASLSQTLANATISAATGVTVTANLTQTLAAATISASGTVVDPPITADLSQTLAAVAVSSDASVVVGASLTQTLADVSISADATHPVSASLAQTLENAAISADATHPVLAALTQTLEDAGVSAATAVIVGASLSVTLEAVAISASGVVENPANNAALTATLEDAALVSAAVAPISASLAATLEAVALSADASHPVLANATQTLADVTLVAAAGAVVTADLAATLEAVAISADGTVSDGPTANLTATLEDVAISASATNPVVGSVQQTLEGVQFLGTVNVVVVGTLAATLGDVTLVSDVNSGAPRIADLSVTLEDVAFSGSATNPEGATVAPGAGGGGLPLPYPRFRRQPLRPETLPFFKPPPRTAYLAARLEDAGLLAHATVSGLGTVAQRRRDALVVLLS